MRRILLALALLLIPLTARAVQDTCTFTGNVLWTATGTTSGGNVSCTGGDGILGGDDIIVIGGGTTTIAAGATITGTSAANAGITVASGQTLVALEGSTIVLGPAGLTASAGSTLRLLGKYRQYGVTPSNMTDAQSNASYLAVGTVVLCPGTGGSLPATTWEPDCTEALPTHQCITDGLGSGCSLNQVRFDWYTSLWDKAGGTYGDTYIDTMLTGLTTHDVACIFDPNPSDAWSPIDRDFCYQITAKNQFGFTFDIRQVGEHADESGYLIANRKVKEIQLSVDHAAGTRAITVPAGTFSASGERKGQMIWFQSDTELCGNGDATPCRIDPKPYRIQDTIDGGAGSDTILLASLDGLDHAVSATCGAGSCRAWITPSGWETGDPVSVWVPVVIKSATTANRDSQISCTGATECTFRAVVANDTGRIRFSGSIGSLSLVDIWQLDPTSDAYAPMVWQVMPAGNYSVIHHTATGGDSDPPGATHLDGQNDHGITMEDQIGDITWNVSNSAYRYITKSCLAYQNAGGYSAIANINRMRCEFSVNGDNGGTNVIQASGGPVTINGSGILAINSGNIYSNFVVTDRDSIKVNLSNVVEIAVTGGFFGSNATSTSTFSNLAIVGGTNGTNFLPFMKSSTFSNMFMREWRAASSGGGVVDGSANDNRVRLNNVLFRDVTSWGTFLALRRDTQISNVAIINPAAVNSGSALMYWNDTEVTAGSFLRGVTVAWSPQVGSLFQSGFYAIPAMTGFTLSGLWVNGYDWSGGTGNFVNLTTAQTDGGASSMSYGEANCFSGNVDNDVSTNALTGMATATAPISRDRMPQHINVRRAQMATVGNATCGAKRAGITRWFPELWMAGVSPESITNVNGAVVNWLPKAF